MALFMEGNQSALILYTAMQPTLNITLHLKQLEPVCGWNLVVKGERDDTNLQYVPSIIIYHEFI